MVSKVPGTVIRSPTDSSGPRVLWNASSLLEVIGNRPMKACTLTADHTSSELLVTQPLTRTLPCCGIEAGVSVSMVRESGASPSAGAAALAAAGGAGAGAGRAAAGVASPRPNVAAATAAPTRAGSSVEARGTPRL
jgi:hypothetical protein